MLPCTVLPRPVPIGLSFSLRAHAVLAALLVAFVGQAHGPRRDEGRIVTEVLL